MNSPRFACAIVPNFPIAVIIKEEPGLASSPLALTDQPLESALILALNDYASHSEVTIGMTAAQGHSHCPDLIVRQRNSTKERQLADTLLTALQTLSPFVEELADGVYALDASGLQFVYRSEHEFAEKIVACVKSHGVPVTVGIAKNKFIAQVAATVTISGSVRIILPGAEQEFLQPLSIAHLPVSEETREKLHDLGLKTMGQVAVFPANELIERFGDDGFMLSRLSRGEDPAFFLPDIPVEQLARTTSLTFTTSNTATITFHVERILQTLLEQLQSTGRACRAVVVTYHLENKSDRSLRLTLDQPAASASPFLRQLRLKMERLTLGAGVTTITVTLSETSPLILEQLAFQQKAGRSVSAPLPDTLAAMPIQSTLYAPELLAAHLPEKNFRLIPLATSKKSKAATSTDRLSHTYSRHRLFGLRLLQPPKPTDIVVKNGQPSLLTARRTFRPIERQSGPWKLSGGWWCDDFDRFYYEIRTEDKQLYLVFYDRLASRWFLQGIFD